MHIEKLLNEFIDILCDFPVIIINNGEITENGMKLREFIHLQGSSDEYCDFIEACLPLIKSELQSVEFNDFSSGIWVIVRK